MFGCFWRYFRVIIFYGYENRMLICLSFDFDCFCFINGIDGIIKDIYEDLVNVIKLVGYQRDIFVIFDDCSVWRDFVVQYGQCSIKFFMEVRRDKFFF